MKYKYYVLFLLLSLCCAKLKAQQSETLDPLKDKKEIDNYTIHLIPGFGKTFGFCITKEKRPIWSQISNPFEHPPLGFKTKTDAYKVAEWIINEDIKNGKLPTSVPPEVGVQLSLLKSNHIH